MRSGTKLVHLRVDARVSARNRLDALTDLGALQSRFTGLHDAVFSVSLAPLDVATAATDIATESHASE